MSDAALESLARAIGASGLIAEGSTGIALVSGGADSSALAAGLCAAIGARAVTALHVNYGLRPDSARDEEICRELCDRLRVELHVERPSLPEGNVQAAARDARYRVGEALRARLEADWIATGHTRTDLAETVLYRLATSPGRRALTGLPARRGAIVRPLLGVGRAEIRALVEVAGLPFRDDPTNVEPLYARNRIRAEVLPVLAEIGPAIEETIAETWGELSEEGEALEALAAEALEHAGIGPGAAAVPAEALEPLPAALRRIALRQLAERAAGGAVPLGRDRVAEIWRLAHDPEGGEVDLGDGLRAVIEQGHIRVSTGDEQIPAEASLTVPGSCRFGQWELTAELRPPPGDLGGPESAVLDAGALGGELEVRSWRDGDRMRPLGLEGTKSLQDLFTDRKVPRSLRRTLPVVARGERIAWVAGVAVSEEFKLDPESDRAAVLSARVR